MGLMDKVMGKTGGESTVKVSGRFSPEEYELLFMLIRNSTFKGEHLELVYNLVLKLQEEYISLKNKV